MLSLCKMKTLEYTIFRRIREMTKALIALSKKNKKKKEMKDKKLNLVM